MVSRCWHVGVIDIRSMAGEWIRLSSERRGTAAGLQSAKSQRWIPIIPTHPAKEGACVSAGINFQGEKGMPSWFLRFYEYLMISRAWCNNVEKLFYIVYLFIFFCFVAFVQRISDGLWQSSAFRKNLISVMQSHPFKMDYGYRPIVAKMIFNRNHFFAAKISKTSTRNS